MRFFFLMFAPILAAPAFAQGEIKTDFDAEMTLVLAASEDNEDGPETKGALAEVSISTGAEYLMQNGVEISGHLTFRAQTDHAARPGFAGAIVDCPPADAACASLNGAAVRGAFSRLSTLGAADETGGMGSLEAAFIAIDGGWGEVVIGRDQGIGQRFYEGGPTVFGLARSSDPILDPFGISLSRTKNDISSTAEKISYVTPRILGFRAGASYTPDASVRRLDLNTSYRRAGVAEPELGEAFEIGLQGYRHLRQADLRLRGSLTWSNAQVENPLYDDVDTVSAGVDIERRDAFRLGVSYLQSGNGGHGDYESLAAGASYWLGDWALTVSGDTSSDETINLEGWSATVGASRELSDNVEISVGYRRGETEYFNIASGAYDRFSRDGVLLEVRIRK